MRRHLRCSFVLILISGLGVTARLAIAQQEHLALSQLAVKTSAAVHNDGPSVGPDTPVITLDGFCDRTSMSVATDEKSCRTVITRSEFERLADASGVPATEASRAQFAANYVQFSLLAREAQKQEMDKAPSFQTKLETARRQLLGQMLIQDLQAKSEHSAPGELEKFFKENPGLFEQATLLRIYIPLTKFEDLPNGVQHPMAETALQMKQVADTIYSRARAGADFEELQKEAWHTANLKEEISAKFGTISRDHLRRSQQAVFDLKVGEISALFPEREEGYFIYKVVSKQMPAYESVKSDVAAELQKQRLDTWMKNITDSVRVRMNDAFFGTDPWAKINSVH